VEGQGAIAAQLKAVVFVGRLAAAAAFAAQAKALSAADRKEVSDGALRFHDSDVSFIHGPHDGLAFEREPRGPD